MVSFPVVFALAFASVCTLIMPVLLLLILCLRHQISQKPMWIGAAAFFVSQICLRLPILATVSQQSWFKEFARNNTILYCFILALTAGLFEESARYVGARCLLKNQHSFRDAVAFGLGHGLCEAVLLVGLTEISNLVFCLMLNSGAISSRMIPSLKASVSAIQTLTPAAVFMAVWERVFTVMFHVFATVLVFRAVRERKIRFWLFAFAAHTLTDFLSPLLSRYNAWAGEGSVCVFGAVGIWLALRMRPAFQKPETAGTDA